MRVGLTGGTGFIGQYLIRDYEQKYDFIVPVRDKKSKKINESRAIYVESDFSVESLKYIFKDCDAVIHLAARGMPKSRQPLKMSDYMPNVFCAANVFEACKNLGIKKIICASTKAVWGNASSNGELVLTESDFPNPDDEYGVSKLCVEMLANFYHSAYGMDIMIYRMGEVCGMDLSRGMQNPFWVAVLQAAMEKRVIPIYGKGISKRDLVYVKDVVRALDIGLEQEKTGVFNIGSGHLTTNIEIAKAFCTVYNNEAGIELHPEKEEWGTELCLSAEKAKNELGYEVEFDLLRLVQDIKEEYKRQDNVER